MENLAVASRRLAESARRDPRRAVECAHEVGEVGEPDVQRDIGDRALFVGQKPCGAPQPRANEILVRRHAKRVGKDAQEVEWTHARGPCCIAELNFAARVRIDPAGRLDRAAPIGRARRARPVFPLRYGFQKACHKGHADFVQREVRAACGARLRKLAEHHQPGNGRHRARTPRCIRSAERVHQLRSELERQALIPAVMMPVRADVLVAGIADQQRPGHQLERLAARVAAEASFAHVRERIAVVRLGEGLVRRGRGAPVVDDRKERALENHACRHLRILRLRACHTHTRVAIRRLEASRRVR